MDSALIEKGYLCRHCSIRHEAGCFSTASLTDTTEVQCAKSKPTWSGVEIGKCVETLSERGIIIFAMQLLYGFKRAY
jgi:hypothetical protein